MTNKKPIIGIIGGAGPDATIDLQLELSRAMKEYLGAITDQEHIRVITDNYTDMPDRSTALEAKGISPLSHMISSAKRLEQLGCDIILYPCNTAHAYLKDIQKSVDTPILDMIYLTCKSIKDDLSYSDKVGMLCTDMTKKLNLYSDDKINFLYPNKENQELVMQAIFAAKAGQIFSAISDPRIINKIRSYLLSINALNPSSPCFKTSATAMLKSAIENLIEHGARKIILGCTEIPLCISDKEIEEQYGVIVYNPTRILAQAAVVALKTQLQPKVNYSEAS